MAGIKGMNTGHKVSQETRAKISKRLINGGRGYSTTSGYKIWHKAGIYKKDHRLIMEKHLGSLLKPTELVHHKDGNPLNNRIDNLEITNNSEHLTFHRRRNYHKHYDLAWLKEQLNNKTQRDIAKECGVSEQAINKFIGRYLEHPKCKSWCEYYKLIQRTKQN